MRASKLLPSVKGLPSFMTQLQKEAESFLNPACMSFGPWHKLYINQPSTEMPLHLSTMVIETQLCDKYNSFTLTRTV